MTMALTGKVAPYKIGFGPSGLGVSRCLPECGAWRDHRGCAESLERIFKADIAPDQVAAIILEPIQGKAALTSRRPISCRRCATCAIPTAFC
ncbi:Gamma-aminobutyrate:alpha-ketoglutarate aminotransferase [Klebsiella pneumoniae]|uniref:Gamma-aminobutyrate:alpha-ketoglutarate aminotransferase n=1 Tax=Klebsiella pneumoniae TaxID=573 RepID=A0A4P0YHP5_KLEPN|nr:Gamma-aminobutyrate:alpha-ketoglutarate aminotransferase [Klebsiella pneumoniae]